MDAPASFEYAKEVVTQVLTLSTGVIALSATFVKDLKTGKVKPDRVFLWSAWALLLMSMLFGVLTLGAMAGVLDSAKPGDVLSIYSQNITNLGKIQVGLFFIGIGALIVQAARKAASA